MLRFQFITNPYNIFLFIYPCFSFLQKVELIDNSIQMGFFPAVIKFQYNDINSGHFFNPATPNSFEPINILFRASIYIYEPKVIAFISPLPRNKIFGIEILHSVDWICFIDLWLDWNEWYRCVCNWRSCSLYTIYLHYMYRMHHTYSMTEYSIIRYHQRFHSSDFFLSILFYQILHICELKSRFNEYSHYFGEIIGKSYRQKRITWFKHITAALNHDVAASFVRNFN